MREIAIARLKATLSAELKRVRAGETVTVLDRTTPVAILAPVPKALNIARRSSNPYEFRQLTPLTTRDPMEYLSEDREDSW